jgi:conserved oligomeric Golgi complex subunit 4
MFSPLARARPTQAGVDDEAPDAREIDKLVTEIAGITGRWSLFRKFLLESYFVRPLEFV